MVSNVGEFIILVPAAAETARTLTLAYQLTLDTRDFPCQYLTLLSWENVDLDQEMPLVSRETEPCLRDKN